MNMNSTGVETMRKITFLSAAQGRTHVYDGERQIGVIDSDPKTGDKVLRMNGPNGGRWRLVTHIFHDHPALTEMVNEFADDIGV